MKTTETIRHERQRNRTIENLKWLKHKAEEGSDVRLYPTDIVWINDLLDELSRTEENPAKDIHPAELPVKER